MWILETRQWSGQESLLHFAWPRPSPSQAQCSANGRKLLNYSFSLQRKKEEGPCSQHSGLLEGARGTAREIGFCLIWLRALMGMAERTKASSLSCYHTRKTAVPETDTKGARDCGLLRRKRGRPLWEITHTNLEKTYPQKRIERISSQ